MACLPGIAAAGQATHEGQCDGVQGHDISLTIFIIIIAIIWCIRAYGYKWRVRQAAFGWHLPPTPARPNHTNGAGNGTKKFCNFVYKVGVSACSNVRSWWQGMHQYPQITNEATYWHTKNDTGTYLEPTGYEIGDRGWYLWKPK